MNEEIETPNEIELPSEAMPETPIEETPIEETATANDELIDELIPEEVELPTDGEVVEEPYEGDNTEAKGTE